MKTKVVFLGTPTIAVSALKSLVNSDDFEVVAVVTNKDKFFGRSRSKTKPSPVKEYAIEKKISLIQTDNINEDIDSLKNIECDYLVTCAFGQFLGEELLKLPKKKAINIHASLLPEGRGGAPIHWSIINGKTETGISIMDMVKEMDAGNFYQQYEIEINDNDTYDSMYDKLSKLIEEKTAFALNEIDNGYESTKQDDSLVSKWLNIRKEDRIINFNKSSAEVYNQIRGLTSIPGAITYYEGEMMKINSSQISDVESEVQTGTIINIDENGILVKCKQGSILIKNITMPGKKPTEVSELVKGNIKIEKDRKFENE